jgi:hypothetical protein
MRELAAATAIGRLSAALVMFPQAATAANNLKSVKSKRMVSPSHCWRGRLVVPDCAFGLRRVRAAMAAANAGALQLEQVPESRRRYHTTPLSVIRPGAAFANGER